MGPPGKATATITALLSALTMVALPGWYCRPASAQATDSTRTSGASGEAPSTNPAQSTPGTAAHSKTSDNTSNTLAAQANTKDSDNSETRRPYATEAIKRYNRAYDLHNQGFFNQAIAEYKLALAADDRMEEAWTNLGLIYAAQRNYSKAQDAFKRSLALNPRRTNALNGLGTVLYARNHLSEAMAKWKTAVEIDPRFASAYFNIGNALENEKDFQAAIEAYASAIAVAPSMADAYYRIGSIYAREKHPAQAAVLLTKAVELQPAADFVHDAKRALQSLDLEVAHDDTDEPGGKKNLVAPASAGKTGGT